MRENRAAASFALSFHSLRHGSPRFLPMPVWPEELRMALTGHRERAVHQRYTHRELQRLAECNRECCRELAKTNVDGNARPTPCGGCRT